jgi:hypothetical protein
VAKSLPTKFKTLVVKTWIRGRVFFLLRVLDVILIQQNHDISIPTSGSRSSSSARRQRCKYTGSQHSLVQHWREQLLGAAGTACAAAVAGDTTTCARALS